MSSDFSRSRRVGEQIQRELADLVRREMKDPRLGMVTFSAVEVSRDLAHAKVFVTVLGDAAALESSLKALRQGAGFLRRELGHRMSLRKVPELHFFYDKSVEEGMHIDALINQAIAEDQAKTEDE